MEALASQLDVDDAYNPPVGAERVRELGLPVGPIDDNVLNTFAAVVEQLDEDVCFEDRLDQLDYVDHVLSTRRHELRCILREKYHTLRSDMMLEGNQQAARAQQLAPATNQSYEDLLLRRPPHDGASSASGDSGWEDLGEASVDDEDEEVDEFEDGEYVDEAEMLQAEQQWLQQQLQDNIEHQQELAWEKQQQFEMLEAQDEAQARALASQDARAQQMSEQEMHMAYMAQMAEDGALSDSDHKALQMLHQLQTEKVRACTPKMRSVHTTSF
jgi:hypothetical protein